MSELLLGALLLLPALAFVPGAQHVFWVPESLAAQLFAPLAALAAWRWRGLGPHSASLPWALKLSAAVGGLWLLLSSALATRPDLAAAQLLEWASYPLAFVAAWRLGQDREGRRRILSFLLLGAALNAAYGLAQALEWDRFAWASNFSGRAGGFLGNPNFLGGHLALTAPLALALALDSRRRGRLLRWLLAGLLYGGLFISQTRGAWAGAALGTALVLFQARQRLPGLLSRNKAMLLGSSLSLLIAGGAFLAARPQLLSRLGDTLAGRDEQVSHRFFLMRKAAQLANRHPLLGVGPGNFRIQYPEVQVQGIPKADLASQIYVQSEHAHNDFLQMAADAGWPASALWLALWVQLLLLIWKGLPKPSEQAMRDDQSQTEPLLLLGLLAGLVSLQIHGLANFPFLLVPTQIATWAMAALALRLALPSLPDSSAGPPAPLGGGGDQPHIFGAAGGWGGKAAGGWALLLLSLAALNAWRCGRTLASDMLWWVGQGELGLGHAKRAQAPLFRALEVSSLPWLGRREDRLWLLHGRALAENGELWNAVGSLKECLRLDPLNPEAAVRLGRTYLEMKLPADAEKVLFPLADRVPNFIDVWEPLAASYFMQQKWADAVAAYDWQIFFNANPESAYANKAAAQGSLGELPKALLTLLAAGERFPQNGKIQLNLAITYVKLGMKKEARQAWEEARRLNPNDPQVDQLKGALR